MTNTYQFNVGLINRYVLPTKMVLVVEDDLRCQSLLANTLLDLFGHQSGARVTLASSAIRRKLKGF